MSFLFFANFTPPAFLLWVRVTSHLFLFSFPLSTSICSTFAFVFSYSIHLSLPSSLTFSLPHYPCFSPTGFFTISLWPSLTPSVLPHHPHSLLPFLLRKSFSIHSVSAIFPRIFCRYSCFQLVLIFSFCYVRNPCVLLSLVAAISIEPPTGSTWIG